MSLNRLCEKERIWYKMDGGLYEDAPNQAAFLFLNRISAFVLGARPPPNQVPSGTTFESLGSFKSQFMSMCAIIALTSLTAKNLPGLEKSQQGKGSTIGHENVPSMATVTEQQVVRVEGDHLVAQRIIFVCTILSHVEEPEPIEIVWVLVVVL